MARLPFVSGDEFVRIMRRGGYTWDHTDGRRLSVPRHRELGRGILRALIHDAKLTREEFIRLYHQ